jgi:hypothetical protein
VTKPSSEPPRPDDGPFAIDITVAHAARAYDYLLGGTDHFAVDREAIDRASEAHVDGLETSRANVRHQRAFLGRAVRYLALEAGIRQFLDIGTGIPNADNVHAVAQEVAPDARIVYVDNDPVVLANAHTLLKGAPEGSTAYVDGDAREPARILARAKETLDLTQPVGVIMVGILHLIRDEDDPRGIVTGLLGPLPSGSHAVISHLANDIRAEEMAEVFGRLNETLRTPFVLRGRGEVTRLFDGLDLLEPGVVTLDRWRPPEPAGGNTPEGRVIPAYGGVARKP